MTNGTKAKKSPSLQATLTPAYGRDYKSKMDAVKDFIEGRDFMFNLMGQSAYVSIRDYKAGDMVKIRYNGGRHAVFYRIADVNL